MLQGKQQVDDLWRSEDKIQEEEENTQSTVENFPASLQPIWESIQGIVQSQSSAIAGTLNGMDADMQTIGRYVASGELFNPFPADIDKAIGKISSAESQKAIQSLQKKLDAFSNHLLTSPKIEACDNFVPASNIRTLLFPKINQLTKIIGLLPG